MNAGLSEINYVYSSNVQHNGTSVNGGSDNNSGVDTGAVFMNSKGLTLANSASADVTFADGTGMIGNIVLWKEYNKKPRGCVNFKKKGGGDTLTDTTLTYFFR